MFVLRWRGWGVIKIKTIKTRVFLKKPDPGKGKYKVDEFITVD